MSILPAFTLYLLIITVWCGVHYSPDRDWSISSWSWYFKAIYYTPFLKNFAKFRLFYSYDHFCIDDYRKIDYRRLCFSTSAMYHLLSDVASIFLMVIQVAPTHFLSNHWLLFSIVIFQFFLRFCSTIPLIYYMYRIRKSLVNRREFSLKIHKTEDAHDYDSRITMIILICTLNLFTIYLACAEAYWSFVGLVNDWLMFLVHGLYESRSSTFQDILLGKTMEKLLET